MRRRALVVLCVALSGSAFFSTAAATAHTREAPGPRDASAPVARTFYIQGPYISNSGFPLTFAGVAAVNVDSTGSFSGTFTMAGSQASTQTVTGTVTMGSMALYATLAGAPLTINARGIVDRVSDRGANNLLPATTAGLEYQGAVTVNGAMAGYVTVIDASIMREYSFTAVVKSGRHRGTSINASLYLLLDRLGGLHGYLLEDNTNDIFPLVSGSLNRGYLIVHIDLEKEGQIVGVATKTKSVIPGLVAYQGTFGGPGGSDSGTWLSAPPEK